MNRKTRRCAEVESGLRNVLSERVHDGSKMCRDAIENPFFREIGERDLLNLSRQEKREDVSGDDSSNVSEPSTSPSRITSSPSPSHEPSPTHSPEPSPTHSPEPSPTHSPEPSFEQSPEHTTAATT
ncbi:hypothetical protein Tco_1314714 [Tanacetum coccineum]